MKILFHLKVVLSQEWAKPLLMRGTGASYISHRSLLEFPLPMGFSDGYDAPHYRAFIDSERARSKNKSAPGSAGCGPADEESLEFDINMPVGALRRRDV